MTAWRSIGSALRDPRCDGIGSLQLAAGMPFWDEAAIPFEMHGGGAVCRVVPSPGFDRDALGSSADQRLLIVDCPDADGWIVPQAIVAEWMARHITNAELDDILIGHPLYEHLTRLDDRGHSRAGRTPMVQWTPGVPTVAMLRAPEFLPDDPEAPTVNRSRPAYAAAVTDLLRTLEKHFDLRDIEVGILMQSDNPRPPDEGEGEPDEE